MGDLIPSDELHDLHVALLSGRIPVDAAESVIGNRLQMMGARGAEVAIPFDLPDPADRADLAEAMSTHPIVDD